MKEEISVLIGEDKIKTRLKEIAMQINKDFYDEEVILICILKGSVYITCELSKYINVPVVMDFMSVSSYGNSTESSGRVRIIKDLDESIEDKNVIVVEDIIDSGTTLSYLTDMLRSRKPKKLKVCTLLDKPDRRLADCSLKVDYTGFVIPDEFVVGYGMDYTQKYRNLPYVGIIHFN